MDQLGECLTEQGSVPVREQDGAVVGQNVKALRHMRLDMHESGRPVVAQRPPAKKGHVHIRFPADAQLSPGGLAGQPDKAGQAFFRPATQGPVERLQAVVERILAK